MKKWAGLALIFGAIALFLLLNRAAYKGYFQDDDLDTLSWAGKFPARAFLQWLLPLRLPPNNFRPVGAFYYYVLGTTFGLDFPKYLVPLQAFHLLNIWLLWLLIRKVGIGSPAAVAGVFFFAFHAVLIDAWWKPMYVFDVLCATFCLLALFFYASDRWILALVSFWLACKSKELAFMLPAVLACYELWLGQKRWKRLAPFFAVSLLLGVQAATVSHVGTPYELRLGFHTQSATLGFYSSQLFLLPYAGLFLLVLPIFLRDRRLWLGLAAMSLLMAPLLLLPGRLFAVYWYVPLMGVALVLASIADGRYRTVVLIFLLLWIPWDFLHFREFRRANLRREQQNHAYVGEIEKFARLNPAERTFVYDDLPEGFHHWGVTGALKFIYRNSDLTVQQLDQPESQELLDHGNAAWLHWNSRLDRLDIIRYPHEGSLLAYLKMDVSFPANQLLDGWHNLEGNFRWTEPDATAVLFRPEEARHFELIACLPQEQILRYHTVALRVLLDAQPLGQHEFTTPGCQTVSWPVPPGPAGKERVEFHSAPPYPAPKPDPRILGISVSAFGFTPN